VPIDGVSFGKRIYWTDAAHDYTLQSTITKKHTHTDTSVHSHFFGSRYSVAASMVDVPPPLGCRTIPGLSYHLLTTAEPQQLSNSLTHSPANSRFSRNRSCSSFYSLGKDLTENAASNSYSIVACVLRPLPNNGCCITAYFAVVAYQRDYMPQYY
jgi:hypothetical protein